MLFILDEKEIDSWIRLTRVLTHEIMNSVTPITSLSDTLLSMCSLSPGRQFSIFSMSVASTLLNWRICVNMLSPRSLNQALNRVGHILYNVKAETAQQEKYYELILDFVSTG